MRRVVRRTILGLTLLVLAAGLAASTADAARKKKCQKLCREVIAACKATQCAELTRKERRRCNRDCKKTTIAACKASPEVTDACLPGSPSAAFLDLPSSGF